MAWKIKGKESFLLVWGSPRGGGREEMSSLDLNFIKSLGP